jgi:hypothetical protein
LVANSAQIAGLDDAAASADVVVDRWREGRPAADEDEEIAAIAVDLRDLEAALTGTGRPDAVLLAAVSNAALAAVIVATKAGTPVACVNVPGRDPEGTNARLIRQLADRELAPEPAVIVDWVRGIYTARA